ncbi:MAG: hypothetical protein JWO55_660 [Candidatus Saccharibacteria bacterium]|nr:hypothetical protein [Candidatus Saccharibacteria bacterium]
MNEQLLVRIFEIVLAAATLGAITIILAAAWYDMRAVAQKNRLRSIATNLSRTIQPHITILVYAHNNTSTINDCLEKIVVNDYEKYKILIVDNASADNTVATVARYKKSHPKLPVTVYSRKKTTDRLVALREAYSVMGKNELILILNATDSVHPTLLKEAVAYFILNKKHSLLILRTFTKFDHHFSTLSRQFIQLTKNILFKARFFRTTAETTKKSYTDLPLMVRSSHFTSDPVPIKSTTSYASSIVIITPFNRPINAKTGIIKTIVKILFTLMILSVMTYFFYTAATLQSDTILALSWLLTVLWLLAITWSDEVMAYKDKLQLTTTVPFMYFMFYISLMIYLRRIAWLGIRARSSPIISVGNVLDAIQLELYSTRY